MSVKSKIKALLPAPVLGGFRRLFNATAILLNKLFMANTVLASFFYGLLNHKFSREHHAVLKGKHAYQLKLAQIEKSSFLLRRNIHRLEKGLLMQPRRDVFGEAFIAETIHHFKLALNAPSFDPDELKWASDVLSAYFDAVQDTAIIQKQRCIFQSFAVTRHPHDAFVPYSVQSLAEAQVSYQQLFALCSKRKSVRWFLDQPVPATLVQQAIDLALLAPSACNRQPFKFYVSSSVSKARDIARLAPGTPGWVDNIQCLVVVVGDLSAFADERDRHLIYTDSALASMQFMLALESLGLASCPINWPDIADNEKRIKQKIQLNDFERPVMLMAVGYAEPEGCVAYSQKKTSANVMERF